MRFDFPLAILSIQMAERFGNGPGALAPEFGNNHLDVYRHPEVCPAPRRRNISLKIIFVGASTCALIVQLAGCSSPRQSDVRVSSRSPKALLLNASEIGRGWSILQPVSTTKLEQLSNEANCRLGPHESPVGGVIASVMFISPGALSEVGETVISPATPSGAYSRLLDHVNHCARTIDQALPGSRKPASYPLRAVASPGVGTNSIGFEAVLGSKDNSHFYFRAVSRDHCNGLVSRQRFVAPTKEAP
jgi:hypothetical protein